MTAHDGAASSSALKGRIQGFGSGGAPPPSENFAANRFEPNSLGSWFEQAKAGVDAMVEAFDETANAFADAVEDTISAIAGDDREEIQRQNEQLERERRKRLANQAQAKAKAEQEQGGAPQPPPPPQSPNEQAGGQQKAVKAAPLDVGERSGTDWTRVVAQICESGNLEEFVMTIRASSKSEAEEAEVATLIASELLNAVKNDAVLRVLHVIQAVLEAELPNAQAVLKDRCYVKIQKLQGVSLFKQLAGDILCKMGVKEEPSNVASNGNSNGFHQPDLLGPDSTPATSVPSNTCHQCGSPLAPEAKFCGKCGAKRSDVLQVAAPAPASHQADLLDVQAPSASTVSQKAERGQLDDLLGFDTGSSAAVATSLPSLSPSGGSKADAPAIDLFAPAPAHAAVLDLFNAPATSSTAPSQNGLANSKDAAYSALGAGLPLARTPAGVAPAWPAAAPPHVNGFHGLPQNRVQQPLPVVGAGNLFSASHLQATPLAAQEAKKEIKLDDAFELAKSMK